MPFCWVQIVCPISSFNLAYHKSDTSLLPPIMKINFTVKNCEFPKDACTRFYSFCGVRLPWLHLITPREQRFITGHQWVPSFWLGEPCGGEELVVQTTLNNSRPINARGSFPFPAAGSTFQVGSWKVENEPVFSNDFNWLLLFLYLSLICSLAEVI